MDTSATAKRTEQRLKKARGRNGLINRVLRIECLGPTFVFHYRRDSIPRTGTVIRRIAAKQLQIL
jgi:hypothetical protein